MKSHLKDVLPAFVDFFDLRVLIPLLFGQRWAQAEVNSWFHDYSRQHLRSNCKRRTYQEKVMVCVTYPGPGGNFTVTGRSPSSLGPIDSPAART